MDSGELARERRESFRKDFQRARDLYKALLQAYDGSGAELRELRETLQKARGGSGAGLRKALLQAYDESGLREVRELHKALQKAYDESGLRDLHELAAQGFVSNDEDRIKRAIASKLSGIPYIRSVSYAPEQDGWTLVVKHDNDDVGKAMEAIIGETLDLERGGNVPFLDAYVFHMSEDASMMPECATIFER